MRALIVVVVGLVVGCGDGGNRTVKPQDDPEVLRKAEEAERKAANAEAAR